MTDAIKQDLDTLCKGKTIISLDVYGIGCYEGCEGDILFTDGSELRLSDEPTFIPAPMEDNT